MQLRNTDRVQDRHVVKAKALGCTCSRWPGVCCAISVASIVVCVPSCDFFCSSPAQHRPGVSQKTCPDACMRFNTYQAEARHIDLVSTVVPRCYRGGAQRELKQTTG